jgi:hypothetical protein
MRIGNIYALLSKDENPGMNEVTPSICHSERSEESLPRCRKANTKKNGGLEVRQRALTVIGAKRAEPTRSEKLGEQYLFYFDCIKQRIKYALQYL